MCKLTIVDLHQEDELPSSSMSEVAGGLDLTDMQAAAKEYDLIHDMAMSMISGLKS